MKLTDLQHGKPHQSQSDHAPQYIEDNLAEAVQPYGSQRNTDTCDATNQKDGEEKIGFHSKHQGSDPRVELTSGSKPQDEEANQHYQKLAI
jgi:hypothetical protein